LLFISEETFTKCTDKHLPIMQSIKSIGLSRIKFTDTSQFLRPSLQPAKFYEILKL